MGRIILKFATATNFRKVLLWKKEQILVEHRQVIKADTWEMEFNREVRTDTITKESHGKAIESKWHNYKVGEGTMWTIDLHPETFEGDGTS